MTHRSLLLLAFALLLGAPLRGQEVRGVVLDGSSGAGLDGATVELLDSLGVVRGEAVTASDGRFEIRAPDDGFYRLRATRLGYDSVHSDPFQVGMVLRVTLRLSVRPVDADPLLVVGRRPDNLVRAGFYGRMERGVGQFITYREIESRAVGRITDLFRGRAGAQVVLVRSGGERDILMGSGGTMSISGRCYPTIVLDGMVIRRGGVGAEVGRWDEVIHPSQVAAIEAYSSAAGVPTELTRDPGTCGAILIWSR